MSLSPLFSKAQSTQASLKMGIMGLAGSGKTYSATQIAIGLTKLMQKNHLPMGDKPVYFLDTETGSDWVAPIFKKEGIELQTAKTRAFSSLVPAIQEVEKNGALLIIDSITHFWSELQNSYAKAKAKRFGARSYRLQFQDWSYLKAQWSTFTDLFVNSQAHILLCGRAGSEYEYEENEDGKKELVKGGVKMKAEGETGYEPNILVHLERHTGNDKKIYRTATILKDRSTFIDGKVFRNLSFDHLLPHINYLNLGGQHLGVDTTKNTEHNLSTDGKPQWQKDKEEKEILLDEIQAWLLQQCPSRSADDQKKKGDLLEKHFGTRSWKRIESLGLGELQRQYSLLVLDQKIPAQ